ncbi:MAG: aminotransferase class V-fold PLP-dependent enzyme [Bryobacteraceae bacterium]
MNPTAQSAAYLDTAAEGLPPIAVEAALAEYWREKSRGTPGRQRHYAVQAEAEQAVATLLGTTPNDVVLLGNSSDALNLFAHSLDWREGDEVLISDLEFPSNVLVWLRLRRQGVRLIVIPTNNGETHLQDWTAHLSTKTRVVSVSQVSYKTGTQIPFLVELAAETHRAGALFCVDATQALGRVPVTVNGVDFLVASSYKWLLATHGLGIVYIAPQIRERLREATAGWYSVEQLFHAERFSAYTPKKSAGCVQAGMPNFPAIYALNASANFLLNRGIETIDDTLKPLVAHLRQSLVEQGRQLLTPPGKEFASGIVSFASQAPEALMASLAEQGVIVWGGDGRVRISVHLYNDAADIDRCLAALRQ